MSSRAKSAPFSTHARGVPLFDRSRFLDFPRHATKALLDLRDIGSSGFWFLSMQSWLTFWSVVIDIVAVCFFSFYDPSSHDLAATLDWSIIQFIVILPLVGFIWISYCRREKCLNLLSESKCIMTSIIRATKEWTTVSGDDANNNNTRPSNNNNNSANENALSKVHIGFATTLHAMHAYFLPTRFYSRSYPYMGYKTAMIQIALDRSRSQRQIREGLALVDAAICTLRSAGLSSALEAILHERLLHLQIAIDKMSNTKEFGTPQGIRSMACFYVTLIIPLFFAPYWALIANQANFALAFFISIIVQIAMVALLNVALALEDPWDNNGLDGVFIDEQLYEVEQVLIGSGIDPNVLLPTSTAAALFGGTGGKDIRGDTDGNTDSDPSILRDTNGIPLIGQISRVVRVATDTV